MHTIAICAMPAQISAPQNSVEADFDARPVQAVFCAWQARPGNGRLQGHWAEVAVVLAQAGADVAIVGRDRAGLDPTAARVGGTGRRCVIIEADMGTVKGPG